MPHQWVQATIEVLLGKKDRTECGNDRGNSLVAHAGKVPMKVLAVHLSDYCERENILLVIQCMFRSHRSTVDMMVVVRRLQIWRGRKTPPCTCALSIIPNKYDCVDRTFLWDVLAPSGVPPRVVAVIHEFHNGMKTCVRTDEECSDEFHVRKDLMQGCVLAPLLLNMSLAAALRVDKKHFIAIAAIMDNLVQLQPKNNGEKRGTSPIH